MGGEDYQQEGTVLKNLPSFISGLLLPISVPKINDGSTMSTICRLLIFCNSCDFDKKSSASFITLIAESVQIRIENTGRLVYEFNLAHKGFTSAIIEKVAR